MDVKDIAAILGGGAVILWIAKVIGDKLISNYFETKKQNEELRDSMLDERIKWLSTSVDALQKSMEKNTSETQQHKIMMQGLSHELSALRAELKSGQNYYKIALEKLGTVLYSLNYQIKEQRDEIDEIGRVIRKEK